MDSTDFQIMSKMAMQYGLSQLEDPSAVNEYRRMFHAIIELHVL